MIRRISLCLGLLALAAVQGAAETRYILRGSASDISSVAARFGLTITRTAVLDGKPVFLVTAPNPLPPEVIAALKLDPAVQDMDDDDDLKVSEKPAAAEAGQITPSLDALGTAVNDRTAVSYYGNTVRSAYVNQIASTLIGASDAHNYYATGAGIVAVIDTGVDPAHTALAGALVDGYDFIRDLPGTPSEWFDLAPSATATALAQSTVAILDQKGFPAILNQSTVAILDQSTVAILDATQLPASFGHGTMVAGLIHLVAPGARIMPLKAFRSDGTSDLYQIIRAVYYAVDHGATVINMSFELPQTSPELAAAVQYAASHGVICVASAGNDGKQLVVYPAGYPGVIGVGSTNNQDIRSVFSNYGTSSVDTSAPGEALITSYPGNNYAGVWGTSFSAALVSGAVALLDDRYPKMSFSQVQSALDHGKEIDQGMGRARLQLLKIFRSF